MTHFYMVYILRGLNPFLPNVPFLYPLKTSENQGFSEHWEEMGVKFITSEIIEINRKGR